MAWWVWALIAWSTAASVGILCLAAVCARRRVAARGHEPEFGASELLGRLEEFRCAERRVMAPRRH